MPGLPERIHRMCCETLLCCQEFDTHESLKTVFVREELKGYQDRLPDRASNKHDRVAQTIAYLQQQRLKDGRSVLVVFLSTLKENRHEGDGLRDELEKCRMHVQQHYSPPITMAPLPLLSLPKWGDKIITWAKDGKEMVYIKAQDGEFYIDQYPVTRKEYRYFAQKTRRRVPEWNTRTNLLEIFRGLLPEEWNENDAENNLPATRIKPEDALAYAKWSGKRIPTWQEWQLAASSGCSEKTPTYPWGNETDVQFANTLESGYGWPWPVQCSKARTEEYNNSDLMCDAIGNVAEIVIKSGEYLSCGGAYNDTIRNCSIRKLLYLPKHFDAVGFRCLSQRDDFSAIQQKGEN
ncbi:MAG: formylglycine-generating enzyme family protein [Chloroflexaceae bacterium]|nr:formylglycine-generating enzyme family protein [Chloroflexaceae bacterium]